MVVRGWHNVELYDNNEYNLVFWQLFSMLTKSKKKKSIEDSKPTSKQ